MIPARSFWAGIIFVNQLYLTVSGISGFGRQIFVPLFFEEE